MSEKTIFDDYLKDIRSWNEPIIHVVITENEFYISLYENGILKRRKLKGENK